VKKILLVFGTRPEAIKMIPVFKALRSCANLDTRICVTGQHEQMLSQILQEFDVRPDYDLAVMRSSQDLTSVTCSILTGLREMLRVFTPDRVLVHGDTTTAMAACLASYYQRIPVGHVEAGLRTNNVYSPWPEEANRKLISVIADMHFTPTIDTAANLRRENVKDAQIIITGNTVIDALLDTRERIDKDANLQTALRTKFSFLSDNKKLLLVTGHRRESFGSALERICQALAILSQRADLEVVYPVHMNPSVRETVHRLLGSNTSVNLIEPLCYTEFVYLMLRSYAILTDSGGIQEEAPSIRKPVLVMRDTTERPEAQSRGLSQLVGTRTQVIVDNVVKLLVDKSFYDSFTLHENPYGDGFAAQRIASAITAER
jgi:UDP-N-acetylglucosamine 2-epimerase (non-hydrolysing)